MVLNPLTLARRKIAHETSCRPHHHEVRVIALRTLMSSAQESVPHRGLTPCCPSALMPGCFFSIQWVNTFLRSSRECRKGFISCLISSNILGMTYLAHILLVALEKEELQINWYFLYVGVNITAPGIQQHFLATNILVMNIVILAN